MHLPNFAIWNNFIDQHQHQLNAPYSMPNFHFLGANKVQIEFTFWLGFSKQNDTSIVVVGLFNSKDGTPLFYDLFFIYIYLKIDRQKGQIYTKIISIDIFLLSVIHLNML